MKGAYYNENDPYAAQWLRNLAAAGHIAAGDVDERSIKDVSPEDLRSYAQYHLFAGIGGWSRALRLAGWPDDEPVWTGSCPCQPFSAAGRGGGFDDERHLWPEFFRLVCERRPGVVLGEQVASCAGLAWLDLVQADMEEEGYAFGAVDLCAAGVGAPHVRQRLYWVGHADDERSQRRGVRGDRADERAAGAAGVVGIVADSVGWGRHGQDVSVRRARQEQAAPEQRWRVEGVADLMYTGRPEGRSLAGNRPPAGCGKLGGSVHTVADAAVEGRCAQSERSVREDGRSPTQLGRLCDADFWQDCDWILCTDGRARPVEPGTFPLAHGIPGRVGRLRAYGNAIVPPLAAEFIRAYRDCRGPAMTLEDLL